MIRLSVGQLEIDWGKNFRNFDHSPLFQPCDLARVPYYYVDWENPLKEGSDGEEYNLVTVMKDGLSKPLDQVMERIGLLGYTMNHARSEFDHVSRLYGFDTRKFSFDHLTEVLGKVNVASLSADYGEAEGFGKFFRRCLFDKLGLECVVDEPEYVLSHAGETMESLTPYTILRLVARNPLAQGLPVNWQFADLEEEDWAQRDDFIKPVDQKDRFLIVTEGSSDAKIIKHALNLLKPHIADFFDFVDMKEGYPFTGTSNLFNFTKGLISISVQNNVVVLYDNDAEGVFNHNRTMDLNVPGNMRIVKLPDLQEFENFRCIGPSGEHFENINGRAAAIECYLDVEPGAAVRWNNYQRELRVYHGQLVGKRDTMKAFLDQTCLSSGYDFSRIRAVVDMIVSECTLLREFARLCEVEAL
ncbi:MAG: HEPN/Toprim-associated domain-containing protein [Candidatus Tectomicrobia bacterium]|nr:HEPN/Toprim-associated domain-containing protein [Candidatus Tectomicrobia bacterium]